MYVSYTDILFYFLFLTSLILTIKVIARILSETEDLRIAIGNGTAIGKHAIGLGDNTDARTYEDEEYIGHTIDDLIYDSNTATFTQNDTQDFLYKSLSYGHSTSPPPSETMNVEVPSEHKRRKRSELEGNSTSFELVIVN